MPPLALDLADRVRRHRRANLELPSAAPPRPVPPQDLVDRMLKRRADVERAPADGEQDGARDVEGGRRRVAGAPGVDLEARHLRASREGGADLVTEATHGARPRRAASSPLTPRIEPPSEWTVCTSRQREPPSADPREDPSAVRFPAPIQPPRLQMAPGQSERRSPPISPAQARAHALPTGGPVISVGSACGSRPMLASAVPGSRSLQRVVASMSLIASLRK
mmetsp:Transcript_23561/g.67518  ORF Transcript_23561/g.67518 Transcript_23561/m.67518 type:complete len:222 (-) Transcript_23561:340-1005(-)